MAVPRIMVRAAVPALLLGLLLPASAAFSSDESEALKRGIELFDRGDYLAAQEALTRVDRSQLSDREQALRDDYLDRVQVAITMEDKALRDLDDAELAMADSEWATAESLLESVLANEYAAEPLRRSAEIKLAELRAGKTSREAQKAEVVQTHTQTGGAGEPSAPAQTPMTEPVGAATATDVARALTVEADELVRVGRYDEAIAKYGAALRTVPGFPEAVDGLARARQHQANAAAPEADSLIGRIREQDAINWQRTASQFHDVARAIADHVAAERFDAARQLLVRARHVVESGRQFADPVIKYENLRNELEALERNVAAAERTFHEREVARVRREIEDQRSQKLREIEERRAQQIDLLMQQAMQHRKDGDLGAAINVLRQVIAIDPRYQPARWVMDVLEEEKEYRQQRDTRDQLYKQTQRALEDVERSKVPWWQEESAYPDNWLDIINRPERQRPGQSHRDSLLLGALDQPIDVDFPRVPFQNVITRLAADHNLNIIVNWHDLKNAGIDPDAAIDLSLQNPITLKKALTEVLDQAGAGVADLAYDVADGAITIASAPTIASRTYTAVYPINDLLMDVPSFSGAPIPDLRDATQPTVKSDPSEALPWRYGTDVDDEPEPDAERQAKVRRLVEIIMDTVDPESWRERAGQIGTIREINGQLVVTQNSSAQRQIGGLLDKLREQRAIQIAVEAIFLTVSNHYLEELGMDLDIVLNAGNAGYDLLDEGGGNIATDPVLGSRLLLPRTFSRLGFTPATPTLGNATQTTAASVNQPYAQPFLIPQAGGGGGSQLTPIPIVSGVTAFTDPSRLPSDIPGSFAGQTIGPALQILGSFLDNIQVDFLIRATQADSRTSVLTAPRLVVFNGGSAWVAVTVQQNFVSQLQPVVNQGAVAQAPTVGTINAGASLFVRATVTEDRRYVMLLLAPGVTRLLDLQTFPFSGGTGALAAFIQLPTLSAQRVQTMVSVPDGGTLLIGGQKLASETEIEAGVPVLSKIPILKRAYSSRTLVKDEQTLLILIKPRVLIHSEQEQLAFPSFTQG